MRVALLIALFVGVAAVAPGQTPPQPTIRQVMADQVAAWNRGDIPGFMAGYWKSPKTEFVGSRSITRGWATVLDHYRKGYPDKATMGRLAFSDIEVNMLCPDAALVTGMFHLRRVPKPAQDGYFTLVFRRFPEGWRIISDHTA